MSSFSCFAYGLLTRCAHEIVDLIAKSTSILPRLWTAWWVMRSPTFWKAPTFTTVWPWWWIPYNNNSIWARLGSRWRTFWLFYLFDRKRHKLCTKIVKESPKEETAIARTLPQLPNKGLSTNRIRNPEGIVKKYSLSACLYGRPWLYISCCYTYSTNGRW